MTYVREILINPPDEFLREVVRSAGTARSTAIIYWDEYGRRSRDAEEKKDQLCETLVNRLGGGTSEAEDLRSANTEWQYWYDNQVKAGVKFK